MEGEISNRPNAAGAEVDEDNNDVVVVDSMEDVDLAASSRSAGGDSSSAPVVAPAATTATTAEQKSTIESSTTEPPIVAVSDALLGELADSKDNQQQQEQGGKQGGKQQEEATKEEEKTNDNTNKKDKEEETLGDLELAAIDMDLTSASMLDSVRDNNPVIIPAAPLQTPPEKPQALDTSINAKQNSSTTTSPVAAAPPKQPKSPASPLPTLEECLFGVHAAPPPLEPVVELPDAEAIPATKSDDAATVDSNSGTSHPMVLETQSSDLVDDDWDHIREQGLWKHQPHTIDLNQLRKIASRQPGIPEEGSFRALVWRILLGYLPLDNTVWESLLLEKRSQYRRFVADLFQNTADSCTDKGREDLRWKRKLPGSRRASSIMIEQQAILDSFNSSSNSLASPIKRQLNQKGLDKNLLDGIMKNMNALQIQDIKQSYEDDDNPDPNNNTAATQDGEINDGRDLVQSISSSSDDDARHQNHFQRNEARYDDFVDSAKLLDEIRKDVDRTFPDLSFYLDPSRNLGKRRYAALERILFVWSKYNHGVKYVQGMNEIVGTIYYVLANDWNAEWACEAEADTYYLFSILLSEMRDVFLPDLDEADTGIQGRILMMETLLQRHDPEVREHLAEIQVECSYFAIRWWTTLLTREFLLPDTIRLWDSMFASTHKDNFLCYVCVTMVIMIRDKLLKGDFSRCLRMLQSYPSVSMDRLLEASRALWLYEKQITIACHRGNMNLHQAMQAVKPPAALVMAFGLRNNGGLLPRARVDILEQAREAVASAQGWLGRASRFVNKFSGDNDKNSSKTAADKKSKAEEKSAAAAAMNDQENTSEADDMDCIYMSAIQNAQEGKWSY